MILGVVAGVVVGHVQSKLVVGLMGEDYRVREVLRDEPTHTQNIPGTQWTKKCDCLFSISLRFFYLPVYVLPNMTAISTLIGDKPDISLK